MAGKLRLISHKLKIPHAETVATFHSLLTRCSKMESDDLSDYLDDLPDEINLQLGIASAGVILEAFVGKVISDGGKLLKWREYQANISTGRVREWREKKRNETLQNVTATDVTQSRVEERRYTTDTSLHQKIEKMMQGKILVFGRIDAWVKSGADEKLILEVIGRLMKKRNNDPPKTLKYFDDAIADALAEKNQLLPQGKQNGKVTGNNNQVATGNRTGYAKPSKNDVLNAGLAQVLADIHDGKL
jgi:hypothetical protein